LISLVYIGGNFIHSFIHYCYVIQSRAVHCVSAFNRSYVTLQCDLGSVETTGIEVPAQIFIEYRGIYPRLDPDTNLPRTFKLFDATAVPKELASTTAFIGPDAYTYTIRLIHDW
jgi:hypothetical protein